MLRNNANYAAWRQAVQNQLLLAGAHGIIDGSEKEPYRTTGSADRTVRAGSALPTAEESTTMAELKTAEKAEWYKWQKKEEKVQGVIRATVSKGILVDLLDIKSAKAMWDFIEEIHKQDSPEEHAAINNALANVALKDGATAQEMENHLEEFNILLLRAATAKLTITHSDRVQRFLATLPRSLQGLRQQFRLLDEEKRTWREVTKQYNLEVADIRRLEDRKMTEGKALFTKKGTGFGNQRTDKKPPPQEGCIKGGLLQLWKARPLRKGLPKQERWKQEERKQEGCKTQPRCKGSRFKEE